MFSGVDTIDGGYNAEITQQHIDTITYQIQQINHKRIKVFSIFIGIFELFLMLFYDLPRLYKNKEVLIYKVYFTLHGLIFVASIIVLFLLSKYKETSKHKAWEFFEELVILGFMSIMACIGFLDLYKSSQVISYISVLTLCSITVLIKPPRNYIIYSIPHILFLVLSTTLIETSHMSVGRLINSSMYFLGILILSKLTYDNQYSHMIKNITLMHINEALKYLSNHDPLTNISNRRYFEERVKEESRKIGQKEKIIIAMMDIDCFKKVNDQYGHKCGDLVLQQLAAIMKANIRQSDLLARWGGEEFVILFYDIAMDDCKLIVDRIRKVIAKENIKINGHSICVTASFGMCELKYDTYEDINDSYIKVDKLLYKAKDKGRNRVEAG